MAGKDYKDNDDRLGGLLGGAMSPMRPVGDCPGPEELAALADGNVSSREREELYGHLATCEKCRLVYSMVADEVYEAREETPTSPYPRIWTFRRLVPAALAACLALAAGYLLFLSPESHVTHKVMEVAMNDARRTAPQAPTEPAPEMASGPAPEIAAEGNEVPALNGNAQSTTPQAVLEPAPETLAKVEKAPVSSAEEPVAAPKAVKEAAPEAFSRDEGLMSKGRRKPEMNNLNDKAPVTEQKVPSVREYGFAPEPPAAPAAPAAKPAPPAVPDAESTSRSFAAAAAPPSAELPVAESLGQTATEPSYPVTMADSAYSGGYGEAPPTKEPSRDKGYVASRSMQLRTADAAPAPSCSEETETCIIPETPAPASPKVKSNAVAAEKDAESIPKRIEEGTLKSMDMEKKLIVFVPDGTENAVTLEVADKKYLKVVKPGDRVRVYFEAGNTKVAARIKPVRGIVPTGVGC